MITALSLKPVPWTAPISLQLRFRWVLKFPSVEQWVNPIRVVRFGTHERRVENAYHTHLRVRDEHVLVVLVEGIDRAGRDAKALTAWHELNGAFTRNAVHGLKVIGVMHLGSRLRMNRGVVEREPHPLTTKQETSAGPCFTSNGAVLRKLFEFTYDHARDV